MQDIRTVLACALAAVVAAIALNMLTRSADALGLLDIPNDRKLHSGKIPLVGGLSVYAGILVGASWLGGLPHFTRIMLLTSAIPALLGALDDRHDLSVRTRLLVQTAAILAMIACTGVYIRGLGHLFGQELALHWMGIPFTVVAVIGLLNAFNMMDGIDGLAGGLSLMTIVAIFLYGNGSRIHGPAALMLLVGAALIPYLAANLGLLGRKVFLGDAGSMMLGYLFAWTLIDSSQAAPRQLSPVDVLWCVALPVLDTLAVMYRRLRHGRSPFKPDRGHIHHIIMRAGLGPRPTAACLVALAALFAFSGLVIRTFGTEASLLAFGMLVVAYGWITHQAWVHQEKRLNRLASAHVASRPGIEASPLARPGQE